MCEEPRERAARSPGPPGMRVGSRWTRRNRRSRRGALIVESVAALAIVAVGTLTAASVLVTSMKLDETNRENRAAFSAAQAQLEEVRSADFADVLNLYDADPANDPGGAGTAPGNSFWSTSLLRLGDQADVTAVVLLPLSGAEVREDLDMPELGLPRDLNGDGVVDNLDHRADAVILPVGVQLQWTGTGGTRTYVLTTMVHE